MEKDIVNQKCVLRAKIKNMLKDYDLTLLQEMGRQILTFIIPELIKSQKVAIYHAMAGEISLQPIIDFCEKHQVQLYQPIAYKEVKLMRFEYYRANSSSLFMPKEYLPYHEIEWYNLDLIFIPLIAIDKTGCRLGKGGGYYDRTFADILDITKSKRGQYPKLCGIGLHCQMIMDIPADSWDVKLNYFLSENGLTKFY